MISAPSEIRCSAMPEYSMNRKVPASTSGIETATTRPARNPRLRKLTPSTMIRASTRAVVNPPTASSTTAGWFDTRWTPTPIGRSDTISRMRWRRSSPNCTRLPLGFMPIASPIAGWPL